MNKTVLTSFTISGLLSSVILVGFAFNIQAVKASGTIYIRADGSIDPITAPISSLDNVTYTFTDNIYDEIAVERNDTVIDGAGYTVEGTGSGYGISLLRRSNVTIRNMKIKTFHYGIYFYYSPNNTIWRSSLTQNLQGINLAWSSNNTISENNITKNDDNGITLGAHPFELTAHNNVISENNITNNKIGIELAGSSSNIISGNNITGNNMQGVWLRQTLKNSISGNNITANDYGIIFKESSNNTVSGNKLADNRYGMYLGYSSNNTISENNMTINLITGVELSSSSFNTISRNKIIDSLTGIHLHNSSHNNIYENRVDQVILGCGNGVYVYESSENNIKANNVTGHMHGGMYDTHGHGIWLQASVNNTLRNNKMANNTYNIGVTSSFSNDVDISNTVDGKPIYFWINQTDRAVPQDAGFVVLVNCTRITVQNVTLTGNREGIILTWGTNNSTITCNNITNNYIGIVLHRPVDRYDSDNSIYHNNFINNRVHVSTNAHSTWDNGYPSGGNYWGTYNGSDLYSGSYQNETAYDWIGDSPYIIDETNQDNYPLMYPFVPEMEEIRIANRNLLLKHSELLSDFTTLNSTHQELLDNITNLQEKYDSLLTMNNDMQEQIDSLNSTLTLGHEAIAHELSTIRNVMYVFMATTIILIAATVYFAIRKPKIKP